MLIPTDLEGLNSTITLLPNPWRFQSCLGLCLHWSCLNNHVMNKESPLDFKDVMDKNFISPRHWVFQMTFRHLAENCLMHSGDFVPPLKSSCGTFAWWNIKLQLSCHQQSCRNGQEKYVVILNNLHPGMWIKLNYSSSNRKKERKKVNNNRQ